MGWFSKKEPKTRLGRYVERVGAWGLAFGAFACVMVLGLCIEVYQAATMRSVVAEITSVRSDCVLTYTSSGKKREKSAESCDAAYAMKANATDRLYDVEESKIVTMAWAALDGSPVSRELSVRESKPFKKKDVGDRVQVRVGEGTKPAVESRMTLSTVGIFTGAIVIIFWRIWPWKAAKSGGAGIYIRQSRRESGFSDRVREFVSGLAIKGALLGVLGALIGGFLWVSEIRANWTYVEATARVTQIETICKLSYRDEDDKNRNSARMTCERANEIALNDDGVDYTVKTTHTYHLSYVHPVAGETVVEKTKSLLHGSETDVGGTVAILAHPERASRVQVVRQEDSFNVGKFLFHASVAATTFSWLIAYLMGAYIVWPQMPRMRRTARG